MKNELRALVIFLFIFFHLPRSAANLPGPLQQLHAAPNRNAASVKFSDCLARGLAYSAAGNCSNAT
jgi:hypothetical protein